MQLIPNLNTTQLFNLAEIINLKFELDSVSEETNIC